MQHPRRPPPTLTRLPLTHRAHTRAFYAPRILRTAHFTHRAFHATPNLTRCPFSRGAQSHATPILTRCPFSRGAHSHAVPILTRCPASRGAQSHAVPCPVGLTRRQFSTRCLILRSAEFTGCGRFSSSLSTPTQRVGYGPSPFSQSMFTSGF